MSDDMKKDPIASLDTFGEHSKDFSAEVKGMNNEQILDFFLSKKDDELVPWESMTLPSQGLYYGNSCPGGVVQVRPMGIFAEKILSTLRLAKTGQALDMVYKHCVKFPDPNFDPLDLLAGDGTFILFYLRGITFGNLYEFTVTCTDDDCGKQMIKTFDLNQLQATIHTPTPGFEKEPFELELPYASQLFKVPFKVKVRMIRRSDMNHMAATRRASKLIEPTNVQVDKLTKRFKEANAMDSLNDTVEKNLNTVIVEVMGSQDRFKIQQFVEKMHSTDTSFIREHLDKVSPGIDTTITVKCAECNNEMKIMLPITESFFRRKI